ncbi:carboxyl transferase domain-containing protein [Lentzea sp. NPDC051213]|uniref:carboxyl transferase domain-containing protein n=1 Tax=Lentzea sp. NPDC051213 TaxID=3364126 RepID=UPI0037928884
MAGLNALFDPDSATWFGSVYARGDVHGAPAYAYQAASLDTPTADGVVAAVDHAVRDGCPVVGSWCNSKATDSEEIEEIGRVFAAMTRASGWVPQVAVVLERIDGTAAYGPALHDIVVSTDPEIADVLVTTEYEAAFMTRQVVALLGQQGDFGRAPKPGPLEPDEPLDAILDTPLLPLRNEIGRNLQIGLGRLSGRTIGVVAESGPLDAPAAEKAARFVRMCDAFGIPLVVVAGSPEPGREVRSGAKLLHAFAESVVPRITLVTGAANVTMNARSLGATRVFAWPGAQKDGVDELIDPRDTRRALVDAFSRAPLRRGHHRNIPL